MPIRPGLTDALQKIVVFLAYGLGFGLPLVVLSLLAGPGQRQIVGVGDFLINLDSLRLTFGF